MTSAALKGSRWVPWTLVLAVILAVAVVAAGFAFGVLRFGRGGGTGFVAESRDSQLARLAAENQELNQQVIRLQTNEKINREAYQTIEGQLGTLQDKIIEQQEDLSFYRGVVGGTQGAEVRIQRFTLSPDPLRSHFHLQLTLAQSRRAERPISGSLGVRVDGVQGSRPVSMDLAELGGAIAQA
jgi:hypothetical protein